MWSLPYGPMKDLHQQTVKREKEWGGGVGMNEREWASLTTKLSDFGHRQQQAISLKPFPDKQNHWLNSTRVKTYQIINPY